MDVMSTDEGMQLKIWQERAEKGHCYLASRDMPNAKALNLGESVLAIHPKDLVFRMSDFVPDGTLLRDNFCVNGQIIISENLKSHLQTLLVDHQIEFLPLSIADHKGKIVSNDYFILNSLGLIDCIDLEKSKAKFNPLNKRMLLNCKALAFKPKSVSAGLKIFRPMHWGFNTMVTGDFAKLLISTGFSGLRFIEAEGFNGISSMKDDVPT
jgi:hypothetical protein